MKLVNYWVCKVTCRFPRQRGGRFKEATEAGKIPFGTNGMRDGNAATSSGGGSSTADHGSWI